MVKLTSFDGLEKGDVIVIQTTPRDISVYTVYDTLSPEIVRFREIMPIKVYIHEAEFFLLNCSFYPELKRNMHP